MPRDNLALVKGEVQYWTFWWPMWAYYAYDMYILYIYIYLSIYSWWKVLLVIFKIQDNIFLNTSFLRNPRGIKGAEAVITVIHSFLSHAVECRDAGKPRTMCQCTGY